MIRTLKVLQVVLAISSLLVLMNFPGVMAIIATVVGLFYVLCAVGAMKNVRPAIWLAFLVSVSLTLWSAIGVQSSISSGYNYFSGRYEGSGEDLNVPAAVASPEGGDFVPLLVVPPELTDEQLRAMQMRVDYMPYLLLAFVLVSATVVVLHVISWRWMITGQLE